MTQGFIADKPKATVYLHERLLLISRHPKGPQLRLLRALSWDLQLPGLLDFADGGIWDQGLMYFSNK